MFFSKELISQETQFNYSYTGNTQTFITPSPGYYQVELWGASGKTLNSTNAIGGKGAYTAGIVFLEKEFPLYVYVGSSPSNYSAGYNGGGHSSASISGGGGGATDIRLISGVWNNFESLKSRIMVAAGGGGSNYYNNKYGSGGSGGGLTGYFGTSSGVGADQIYVSENHNSMMSLGYGFGYAVYSSGGCSDTENSSIWDTCSCGGSGGSGYYGGSGGSTGYGSGGGGGSSFISGHLGCNAILETSTINKIYHSNQSVHYSGYKFANTKMIDGLGYEWTYQKEQQKPMPNPNGGAYNLGVGHTGNGYARITYLGLKK